MAINTRGSERGGWDWDAIRWTGVMESMEERVERRVRSQVGSMRGGKETVATGTVWGFMGGGWGWRGKSFMFIVLASSGCGC